MSGLPLSNSVLQAASKNAMFVRGGVVVVAVSGGPDSTALLHILWLLRSELGIDLVACHFEHGIRGAESLADAEYVSDLCSSLDIPLRIGHANVPGIAVQRHVTVQVAARDERHRFFRRVAAEVSAAGQERIAIAHTRDDRAETILMNILRGTGPDGLAAMSPVRLPIVRPLIYASRPDIESYCQEAGLNPRIDSTNTKLDYTRNRLRVELLPHLEAYYNSGVRDALLRLGDLAYDDALQLNLQAEQLLSAALQSQTRSDLILDPAIIAAAPRSLQRRAIRAAIGLIRKDLQDISLDAVDSVIDALASGRTTQRTLVSDGGADLQVFTSRNALVFRRQPPLCSQRGWRVALVVPQTIVTPNSAWMVSAQSTRASEFKQCVGDTGYTYLFRHSDVGGSFVLRSWLPGDRIKPKGMAGTKKLQDLYTDCRVPREDRNLCPVLCLPGDEREILAVLGLRAGATAMTMAEAEMAADFDSTAEFIVVTMYKPKANSEA